MKIQSQGSKEKAQQIIKKAVETVPAYKKFLAKHGKTGNEDLEHLPFTSKKEYLLQYPYEELLPIPLHDTFGLFTSSGSSGKEPFFWPYLKEQLTDVHFEGMMATLYGVDKKKTLAILGLSLGSWAGGDGSSFVLKLAAAHAKFPLTTITPGTHIDVIVKVLSRFHKYYDQIVIATSPTVLAHTILTAEEEKIDLPYEKMRYLFFEEVLSEDMRIALQKKSKLSETDPVGYSLFASADTAFIGIESRPSVALRKLAHYNPDFTTHLGFKLASPHFFHATDPNTYLETVNEELCLTKWQGIPLLRYNLHDRAILYSWEKIQETVKHYPFTDPLQKQLAAIILASPAQLPNLFAVFGRADSCINFGGTKIYEYLLDDVIRSEELSKYLTGAYNAKLAFEDIYSYIDILAEVKEEVSEDPETIDKIEDLIESTLAKLNPEFLSDVEKLYKPRRQIKGLKPIKVKTVKWPALSSKSETAVKLRGIIPS